MYMFQKAQLEGDDFKPKCVLNINTILDVNGFSNLFTCIEIGKSWLLKSIDRRIKDVFLQKWNSEVQTNFLCANYKFFKTSLDREVHLTELSFKQRQKHVNFSCDNDKLPITRERWEHRMEGPSLQTCPTV